jgi:predicted DNA-binding transcriptional regulator AlpA
VNVPILLRLKDAAQALGLSRRQFQYAAKHPSFPKPRYIDSRPRWLHAELTAWVTSLPEGK